MTQRRPKPETRNPKPIDVDFSEVQTGEDTRQRGWFWHWNELHTEYEPLLKHSGIGLITSYIVWTDRREHSPYHGFAFPSLQSQAAFSGSDRAELITINRILVALDLIEIRKEMILRADAQGHRWRVPHNLYRVKDRSGSPHLTAADVEQVMSLAAERKEVYRHIRHIFTSGFVPISRDNIWHGILEELRPTELWQRLATQAGEEEARFSQRSRTGHANRKSNAENEATESASKRQLKSVPEPVDATEVYVPGSTTDTGISPVTVVSTRREQPGVTSVAQSNTGSETSVASTNEGLADGLDLDPASMDGQFNTARPSTVARTNSMYDQSIQTTRTNDGGLKKEDLQARNIPVTDPWDLVTFPVTNATPTVSQVPASAVPHQAPEHGPDRQAALVAFAEANERPATAAEIRLLAGIADEINGDQGWAIVTGAIYEAVDSGSAFVAPKRVREIVRRWQREGFPDSVLGTAQQKNASRNSGAPYPPRSSDHNLEVPNASRPDNIADESSDDPADGPFWIDEAGIGSGQLWAALVDVLERRGLARSAEVHDYLKSAQLLGRSGSRGFRLGVAHDLARQRIERKWRADLEDALAEVLGGSGWDLEIRVSA